MKIHSMLVSRALPFLVAAAAIWWGARAPAHAADGFSSTVVGMSGTVAETAENVAFSGRARVSSRLALDPDFNRPTLVLMFDLAEVAGVGTASSKRFSMPTPMIVQRRLAPSHVVEIVFPYLEHGGGPLAAKSAVATFSLTFDVTTGAITGATGSVRTVKF